jgi:hypothetical protein
MSNRVYEIAFQLGAQIQSNFNSTFANANSQISHIGGGLSSAAVTAAKFGVGLVASAGAGAVALFGMATKASEAAANIDDVAQRTGLSAKTLQEFKHAAEMSGTSMEAIEGYAKKLTSTMGKYADGNKDVVGAFDELGLSAEDSKGKLKSTDEMFPQIIAKLAGMKNETERNALSMKLFGKSAADMAPLLNEGTAGVQALKDEAHKMGLVMSDEQVKAGAKFDDALTLMKSSMGAMVTKIGSEVLPMAQSMLDWFANHMPQIQAVTKVAFDIISKVVQSTGGFINNTLMPAFTSLYAWVEPNIPIIKQTMQDAFVLIKTAIQGVSDGIGVAIDWVIKFKDILIPLGAGIAAGALTFGIYSLALGAVTLAIKAHTLATKIATTATTAFGAVMAFITSPIGIAVIAIGALIAVGVLLYKNWDTVGAKINQIWTGIEDIFKTGINKIIQDVNGLIGLLNRIPGVNIPVMATLETSGMKAQTLREGRGSIPQFANGGYVKHRPGGILANIGEGGEDEVVSPVSKLKAMFGSSSKTSGNNSEEPIQIVYSPQIIIQGNADKAVIEEANQKGFDDFKAKYEALKNKNQRLSFNRR